MVRSDPHWILAMPISKSQLVDNPLFACKYLNFRSHLSNTDPPVLFWPCTFAIRRFNIKHHSAFSERMPWLLQRLRATSDGAHVWIMSLQHIHKGNLNTFLVIFHLPNLIVHQIKQEWLNLHMLLHSDGCSPSH